MLATAVAIAGNDARLSKDQQAARKVYVAKCAKCHRFYDPKLYDDAAWADWMTKMARKSKLKASQTDSLTRYIDAYRRGEFPQKPESK